MEERVEVLSYGSRYILSSYGPGLLCVSSFISMVRCVWRSVCDPGWTWLLPVGVGERKMCENSFGW